MKILNLEKMVALLKSGENLFTIKPDSTCPSANTQVLLELVNLAKLYSVKKLSDTKFYLYDNGVIVENSKFYPFLNLPFASAFCHVRPNVPFESLITALESSSVYRRKPFATEALGFNFNNRELDKRFIYVNSPYTELSKCKSLDDYYATLQAKRRYKVKQALKLTSNDCVEVSDTLHDMDIEFVIASLTAKWIKPDLVEFAVYNFLSALACSKYGFAKFIKIKVSDKTWVIAYFIIREDEAIFQGIVSDNSVRSNDAGICALANFIAWAIKTKYITKLDVTALSLICNSSIDIYKRHVVNTDQLLPLVAIVASKEFDYGFRPPFFDKSESSWDIADSEIFVFGDKI